MMPAVYIGTVEGFRNVPAIDLYNLMVPVGEHPIGSTVSRKTLERYGYQLPRLSVRAREHARRGVRHGVPRLQAAW
jgi:hypothetical protein